MAEQEVAKPKPLGAILDALGIEATLGADDQVTDALVICKIQNFAEGSTAVGMYRSDGMDWVTRLGLLTAASGINTDCEHPFESDGE